MKTLAIETSCDDTSLGIISFDGKIFTVDKLLAYSQVSDHQKYGGVVPEIASRLHSEKIISVLENIWRDEISKIDFISVTTHPGLPGSLVVGKATANLLSEYFQKQLIEVNHIYWHIFSLFLERKINEIEFPMVVLTASGGHNDIYLIRNDKLEIINEEWKIKKAKCWMLNAKCQKFQFKIEKIWNTLDDAAGECFDKVARMLGWPYPGGQWISDKAKKWKTNSDFQFKRIFLSKDKFQFSFSWMKSQVSYLLKKLEKKWIKLIEKIICDIAYEFQEAVVEVLAKKLIRAWIKYDAKTLGIAGGVSANERLRNYLNEKLEMWNVKCEMWNDKVKTIRPMKKIYCTDNAGMIWVAWIIMKNR